MQQPTRASKSLHQMKEASLKHLYPERSVEGLGVEVGGDYKDIEHVVFWE